MSVVQILMKRDNMTENEARCLVVDTAEEILNGDPSDAADVLMDNLGLEPDYLEEVLWVVQEY